MGRIPDTVLANEEEERIRREAEAQAPTSEQQPRVPEEPVARAEPSAAQSIAAQAAEADSNLRELRTGMTDAQRREEDRRRGQTRNIDLRLAEYRAGQERREAEKGLSVREILAKRKLEGGPTGLQRQAAAGVRAKEMERPGYLADMGGSRWRKGTRREMRAREVAGPLQQEAEAAWRGVSRGMRDTMGRARNLAEYEEQFQQMRDLAGKSAPYAERAMQEDFVKMMPPDVRQEYRIRQEQEAADRDAEQAAKRFRVLQIAKEEAEIESEESGRGAKLRDIMKEEVKARTSAGIEAQEEAATMFAEARRERRAADVASEAAAQAKARGDNAEAEGQAAAARAASERAATYEARANEADARAKAAGAEREAEIGVETGLLEKERGLSKAKAESALKTRQETAEERALTEAAERRAQLREQKALVKEEGELAQMKQEELRRIEDALPPTERERAATARNGYEASRSQAQSLEKELTRLQEIHGKVQQGKLILISPEQFAEVEDRLEQAQADMSYWEEQYQDAAGMDAPPQLAPRSVLPVETTARQAEAKTEYEKRLMQLSMKGKPLNANEVKDLNKLWARTGEPTSQAPHAPRERREPRQRPVESPIEREAKTQKPTSMEDYFLKGIIEARKKGEMSASRALAMFEAMDIEIPDDVRMKLEAEAQAEPAQSTATP